MPLWSSPLAIKATLLSPDGGSSETRRVQLPSASIKFGEAVKLLSGRFGVSIAEKATYVDEDSLSITVTSDEEWKDALAMGVLNFQISKVSKSLSDDWEIVGTQAVSSQIVQDGISWTSSIQFWVNGEEVVVQNPSPNVRLLDWLRDMKGLNGTRAGCQEGGCGICTVALGRFNPSTKSVELVPINSCLRRLCAVDGCHIITTQGIGCKDKGFHPIQSAIAAGNGSQCGFCTPGWVMNMYALLEKSKNPSAEEVEQHFDGNLCRCTGYRPILSSFGTFAKGGSRCGEHKSVMHPSALLDRATEPLHFVDSGTGEEWYRPLSLEQYLTVMSACKGKTLRPLVASTADGVEKYLTKPGQSHAGTVYIDISLLPELADCQISAEGARFGAALSLAIVLESLEAASANTPAYKVLASHMKRIASVQIRSVASWGGNVMFTRNHPEFQSDLVTILAAAGAKFDVLQRSSAGLSSQTTVDVADLLKMEGDVLLMSMTIPRIPANVVFRTFKTSMRHVFAHAFVNFGACLTLDDQTGAVKSGRLVLAGATATLLSATNTMKAIMCKPLNDATFKLAVAAIKRDVATNPSKTLLQSPAYREQLVLSFLYKTFLAARASVPASMQSALTTFVTAEARPVSKGTEDFGTDPSEGPVGQYVVKRSAAVQASGEAIYPSDYGTGALFGQLVLSSSANAKLVSIDPSEALKMPGVHDFITASAIPGQNVVNGSLGGDNLKEKLFWEVGDTIPCVGVSLGVIVADTWRQARDASLRVKQVYGNEAAVVSDLAQAIRLRSTSSGAMPAGQKHNRRAVKDEHASGVEFAALEKTAPSNVLRVKNTFKTGGQSHFYMETQSVFAVPYDGNHWDVVVSDQDSNFTQGCLAMILNLPQHNLNVKVPRAGGGFGGKLTRQCWTAGAAVVAAHKLARPVRIQNERTDDMRLVGGREPIQFDYDVTFEPDGKLDSLDMMCTMDPGWFYGDCAGDMSMATAWSDNVFKYNKFKVDSQAAVTHTPHRTSMRAPGCMQSILASCVIVEHVAKSVGKSVDEIIDMNMYKVNDTTPFGDHIGHDGYNWTVPILCDKVRQSSHYEERKKLVEAYNRTNRWTKKGIAMTPVKYVMGIDFYASGALVNIYGDGTIMVSTGGSEIGQGLNVKVALCVANALGAPLEKVVVGPRETSKVPNNTGTGGSGTSECTSEAAILACEELAPKLKPYIEQKKKWEDAVAAALADKVCLMASGWYQYQKGENANAYATQGCAVCETTIDVLTGEVQVDRLDVIMDFGNQLDAAVDIGQLQGGFVIALGLLLTEEQKVDSKGTPLTLGTWEYKIPSAYDIPLEFNVALLEDSPNPRGIKGSKASAEPAMCLLSAVYLALKNAIYAARKENMGNDDWFMLHTPVTPEAVRAAVGLSEDKLLLPPQ
mmetsp:Transcript_75907/g.158286  ORF Transcript_75907/g.158286 Transcript_75907/m.158286 type:complete len:1405 (-) Transcript_75907:223-4437(-)